jgi:hypothetical protein
MVKFLIFLYLSLSTMAIGRANEPLGQPLNEPQDRQGLVLENYQCLEQSSCSLSKAGSPNFQLIATEECCKICRKGQACGNSCISWSKTCHQPPGCACQE